jgi:hypothetical protein
VQPYAAARRPNTRPRDRCIRAARVALICVGQRRQRVSRSRKIEPRETPSSGIRPNAKQLVSSLWPMHETRQPAFQWWRGLRRFVRRPDLDERERAGRGAVHMQPPRRCTTNAGAPRSESPETRYPHWNGPTFGHRRASRRSPPAHHIPSGSPSAISCSSSGHSSITARSPSAVTILWQVRLNRGGRPERCAPPERQRIRRPPATPARACSP